MKKLRDLSSLVYRTGIISTTLWHREKSLFLGTQWSDHVFNGFVLRFRESFYGCKENYFWLPVTNRRFAHLDWGLNWYLLLVNVVNPPEAKGTHFLDYRFYGNSLDISRNKGYLFLQPVPLSSKRPTHCPFLHCQSRSTNLKSRNLLFNNL